MSRSLSLEAFAEITARIDAGQPKDRVLNASGVSGEEFEAEQRYWLFEMNRQLTRQRYELEREYSALYVLYRLRFQGQTMPDRPQSASASPLQEPLSAETISAALALSAQGRRLAGAGALTSAVTATAEPPQVSLSGLPAFFVEPAPPAAGAPGSPGHPLPAAGSAGDVVHPQAEPARQPPAPEAGAQAFFVGASVAASVAGQGTLGEAGGSVAREPSVLAPGVAMSAAAPARGAFFVSAGIEANPMVAPAVETASAAQPSRLAQRAGGAVNLEGATGDSSRGRLGSSGVTGAGRRAKAVSVSGDGRRGFPPAPSPGRELPARGQPTPRVALPAATRAVGRQSLSAVPPVSPAVSPAVGSAPGSLAPGHAQPSATPLVAGSQPEKLNQSKLIHNVTPELVPAPGGTPSAQPVSPGALTVDQHAHLQAKLHLHPGRAREICQEFGLDEGEQRVAFQDLGRRMGLDPELRERFLQLYEHYRAKFVAPG